MTSLAEHNPELIEEWDFEKNNELGITPENVSYGTEKKAWWICKKCGYSWLSNIESRTRKKRYGCPICGHRIVVDGINDLKTLYPLLMKEWDYEKNNETGLYPNEVAHRSDKKAYWLCPICGFSYYTAIKNRTRGSGCPNCSGELRTSFPEQAIYYYLKLLFNDAENRMNILGKEADIFVKSLNICVEYDGVYYHNTEESLEREKNKYKHMQKIGVTLIRIREKGLNDVSYADYSLYLSKRRPEKELEEVIAELFEIINLLFDIDLKVDINIKRDRQNIYEQYLIMRKENSIEKKYPNLLNKWDYEKNKINPSSFVPGSEKKVWWKCEKGHSYEQQIAAHIKGNKCPVCANKVVIEGYNDLKTLKPELAKEWDYEKNEFGPEHYTCGSQKKVWWKCKKGHSFLNSIYHRTAKKSEGCPYCSNRKIIVGYNDLKTLKPELAKEWDYEKNEFGPEHYTCGSQKKVWWKCKKFNHSYLSVIRSRANVNTDCPVCNGKLVLEGFNDFESQQPLLLKEWNYEKNDELGLYPNKIHMHSWKLVWWKCKKCGHEWKATPGRRSEGTGCIICSNKRSGIKRKKKIST